MGKYRLKEIENTNVRLLLQAAQKLDIDWYMVDDDRYQVILEKKGICHEVTAHSFRLNSQESIQLTKNKFKTYLLLEKHCLPVLGKLVIRSKKDYLNKYAKIPFPQTIKPNQGEKGRHVYLDIKNKESALSALKAILKKYPSALLEPYFPGHDIRIMLLDHQVVGICKRKPPEITGDGKKTIRQLIEKENQRRLELAKKSDFRMLNRILNFNRVGWYLEKKGLTLISILPKGKRIKLYQLPNYSTGGSVIALEKEEIHPSFLSLSEKISKIFDLTIIGIDWIIKDLKKSAHPKNCAVLEVNSDPGLRLHDLPNQGKSQQVSEKVLKYIFKEK